VVIRPRRAKGEAASRRLWTSPHLTRTPPHHAARWETSWFVATAGGVGLASGVDDRSTCGLGCAMRVGREADPPVWPQTESRGQDRHAFAPRAPACPPWDDVRVDLMGRLSNPGKDFVQVSDKGVRDHGCRRDLEVEGARQLAADNRQTQIRLGHTDIERLIAAYAEGSSVLQLAARFNIHRTTVLAHLERNGVPRRRSGPKLRDEDVHEAAVLYRDELSLKAIGVRFLVAPDTIGKALRRVGVKIRPRRGWTRA